MKKTGKILKKSCSVRLLAEVRCASWAELGSGEGGSKLHNAWQGPVLTSLQQAAVWVAGSKAGGAGRGWGFVSFLCTWHASSKYWL